MASFGARDNTKKQMQEVLRMPSDDNVSKSGYQNLIDSLNVIILFFFTKIIKTKFKIFYCFYINKFIINITECKGSGSKTRQQNLSQCQP